MEILRARELEYSYRNKYQIVNALRGVSCGFEKGRIYAVTGPSGCGKTTFLSLLAGLDVPTGGRVEFEGRATSELDRDEYRLGHVSVIYQNFNLFGHLTVLENAAYPLYVRGLSAKEAESAAAEKLLSVGLTPEQFLDKVREVYEVRKSDKAVHPQKKGQAALYLENQWYLLTAQEEIIPDDPVGKLDVSILQENLSSFLYLVYYTCL